MMCKCSWCRRPALLLLLCSVISSAELVLDDQILVDAVRRLMLSQPLFNHLRQRSALTGSARFGPGGHNGWFCFPQQSQIPADGQNTEPDK